MFKYPMNFTNLHEKGTR